RYDDLLARFGAPMPAAGFALDLDNLAWALRVRGSDETVEPRLLVDVGPGSMALCAALRSRSVGCAVAPKSDPEAYARAWSFSHVLRVSSKKELELLELATGGRRTVAQGPDPGGQEEEVASRLAQSLGSR